MIKRFISIIYFSTLFVALIGNANAFRCSAKGTELIYVNGVLTINDLDSDEKVEGGFAESISRMEQLYTRLSDEQKYGIDTHPKNDLVVSGVNNSSNGKLDFVETFAQKLMEQGYSSDEAWKIIADLRSGSSSTYTGKIYGINPKVFLKRILEDYNASMIGDLQKVEEADVNKIYNAVKTKLKEGVKVFLVSHSQGGLFSTRVHSKLLNDSEMVNDQPSHLPLNHKAELLPHIKYYKNFQIATPSSSPPGTHFTLDSDRIINRVRDIWGAASPTHKFKSYLDLLTDSGINHGLVNTYLSDKNVVRLSSGLEQPASSVFTGELTFMGTSMPNNCEIPLPEYEVTTENGNWEGKAKIIIKIAKDKWKDYHKEVLPTLKTQIINAGQVFTGSGWTYSFDENTPDEEYVKEISYDVPRDFSGREYNKKVGLTANDKYGLLSEFFEEEANFRACLGAECCHPSQSYAKSGTTEKCCSGTANIVPDGVVCCAEGTTFYPYNNSGVCCAEGETPNEYGFCKPPFSAPNIAGSPTCEATDYNEDGSWLLWHWNLPAVTSNPSIQSMYWYRCGGETECTAMAQVYSSPVSYPGGPENTRIHLRVTDWFGSTYELANGSCSQAEQ